MPENEIITKPEHEASMSTANAESEIVSIIRAAVDNKTDVAAIEKLIALKNQQDDRQAAREFDAALAAFQANCPKIVKNKEVRSAPAKGNRLLYMYATFDRIADTIRAPLEAAGLSYGFRSIKVEGTQQVTCRVSHTGGGFREATFTSTIDRTDIQSNSQAAGGAVTFGMRMALIQVLALTTAQDDTDARKVDGDESEGEIVKIGDGQQANIQALIDEVKVNKAGFLGLLGVKSLADIPLLMYETAVRLLEAKRK